jgi:transposase
MRPPGTPEQLAKRRQKALDLLESGKAIKEIARQMRTTERSVRRWREAAKHPKIKSKRGPGKPGYLSKQQIQKLEWELLKGAYAHGYAEDYWTLDRIGHVIWELFGVRYATSGVWRLLSRMGWSNQRVQRLAIQRDEEKIQNWKVHQLPRIKKTT